MTNRIRDISVAIILLAAILFTGCSADTGNATEKLPVEPITDTDENAVQTNTRTENETEETKDEAAADENSVTGKNGAGTNTGIGMTEQTYIADHSETPADETAVYEDVLAQYRDMVQHDFYWDFLDSDEYDSYFGKDIGEEIRSNSRQNIFYALYDIDGNGTKELIIAGEEGDVGVSNPAFAPWYYDIYGYNGSKVVSLFPDMELGGRTNFSLYGDGVIEISHSLPRWELAIEIYKMGSDGVTPVLIDSFYTVANSEGEKAVFTYYHKGTKNGTEITEEAYRSALHNYETPLAEELHWEEIY